MPFTVLPTPGERLLIPGRAGCHITVIYRVIKDCKLSTVSVADRQLIAETEVDIARSRSTATILQVRCARRLASDEKSTAVGSLTIIVRILVILLVYILTPDSGCRKPAMQRKVKAAQKTAPGLLGAQSRAEYPLQITLGGAART